jgi:predicted GIY-YIG superfamily endonuclease
MVDPRSIDAARRRSGDPNLITKGTAGFMDRHFAGNSADSIRAIARTAYSKREAAVLRDAIFELSHFRTTSEARRLLQELGPLLGELEQQGTAPHGRDEEFQPPGAWLSRVQEIAREHGGNHSIGPRSVYLVLLRGPRHPDGFGVYVGETGLTPEQRFWNHKNGHKSSKHVRKYGVRLLRPLFDHLQGLSREDAKRIEKELAKALADAGFWVEGGR